MADVTGAKEMGSVVGMEGTNTTNPDGNSWYVGTVVGNSDPSTEETGNGITAHRLGSVYTVNYDQVTQP